MGYNWVKQCLNDSLRHPFIPQIYILDEVSNFSKHSSKNGIQEKKYASKELFIQDMRKSINSLIDRWQVQQISKLTSLGDLDGTLNFTFK